MTDICFIKLGGSLITDKRREGYARAEVITRLATEIRDLRRQTSVRWVVGHGSGSFGHFEAHRYGIHLGLSSPDQLPGVAATQSRARALHTLVLDALREAGEAPFSIAPSSSLIFAGGEPADVWLEPLRGALELGLLPTVYGDVVMDRERGFGICSTETLFVSLISALQEHGSQVGGVYWLGETEGVLDARGELIAEVDRPGADQLLDQIDGASGRDVTGGMRHRLASVLELADRGVPSWIGNGLEPGRLAGVVRGESVPGTWMRP
jgi:isopentenyl phosphate kinase